MKKQLHKIREEKILLSVFSWKRKFQMSTHNHTQEEFKKLMYFSVSTLGFQIIFRQSYGFGTKDHLGFRLKFEYEGNTH